MSRLALAPLAVAVLTTVSTPAADAGGEATAPPSRVFKLERQPLGRADLLRPGWNQEMTRPLDPPPRGVSGFDAVGTELCFTRRGRRLHKVVLTRSSRRRARYDRLYFDSDGDGEFSESECHDISHSHGPVKIEARRSRGSEVIVQPIKVLSGQGASAVSNWIVMGIWLPDQGQPILRYAGITHLVAEVSFGDKTHRMAVYAVGPFDATTGYDRRVAWEQKTTPDKQKYINLGLKLLLDVNGNKTFDDTGSYDIKPESMRTTRLQRVDGSYWEVAVAPDGGSVRVTPANPEVGTLAIPDGVESGSVLGPEFGACVKKGDKALELPVGRYVLLKYQYCTSAGGLTARDYLMAAPFEIRAGQTTASRRARRCE